MASGTIRGSVHDGHYYAWVEWESTPNYSNNTSFVKATLYFGCDWEISIGGRTHIIEIDGEEFEINDTPTSGTNPKGWALGYATKTIEHENDGTGIFSLKFIYNLDATIGGIYHSIIEADQYPCVLDNIPRASSFKLSDYYPKIEDTIGINISKASNFYTHDLEYSFVNNDRYLIARNVDTNYNWKIPKSLSDKIRNSNYGNGKIFCITKNNGIIIGETSVSFTANVPNYKPTVYNYNCELTNENPIVDDWNLALQDYTKVRAIANASGDYSSTINKFILSYNGITKEIPSSTLNYLTDIITGNGKIDFNIQAVDSRNRYSDPISRTIEFYPYDIPKITKFEAQRKQNEPNKVIVMCDWSYSDIAGQNSATIKLQYKLTSETQWTTYSGELEKNNYTLLDGEFPDTSTYDFKVTITDDLGNSSDNSSTSSTTYCLLDFKSGGKGLAIGKIAEKDGFELYMDSYISKDINIFDKVRVNSIYKNSKGIETKDGLLEFDNHRIYYVFEHTNESSNDKGNNLGNASYDLKTSPYYTIGDVIDVDNNIITGVVYDNDVYFSIPILKPILGQDINLQEVTKFNIICNGNNTDALSYLDLTIKYAIIISDCICNGNIRLKLKDGAISSLGLMNNSVIGVAFSGKFNIS